jgi:hypothetical protein
MKNIILYPTIFLIFENSPPSPSSPLECSEIIYIFGEEGKKG